MINSDRKITQTEKNSNMNTHSEFLEINNIKKAFVNDFNVKIVEKECPINSKIMMLDLSMESKGVDEELIYLQNQYYIKNLRRGNTLVEIYYYDNYEGYILEYTLMARRGLMKFVDLPYDSIETKDFRFKKTDHILDENKLRCRNLIITPMLASLSLNKRINIFKLIKANGENAQISYIENFKMWVIASKNVALLARNRSDLENYYPVNQRGESTRFYFAYVIGHCFFDILDNLTKEKITNLKIYLKDKTMIGEYVGNQNHQHLVRYTKHTILFYAIVNNYGDENCLPVLESYKIFEKSGLDVVAYEFIGSFDDHFSICKALETLYNRIGESSIIDEEEGSVLYISEVDQVNFKEKILSLCKLKTLEYRVYRKLREKIKNHNPYEETSRRKINQFFEEVRIMLQGYTLPMPMSFYYKVAETAFAFVNKFPEQCFNIHSNYIDFLEVIHSLVDQTVSLKSQMIRSDVYEMSYDSLIINNSNYLMSKNVFSVIIYAPPLYLPEEFLKALQTRFDTEIINSLYHDGSLSFSSDLNTASMIQNLPTSSKSTYKEGKFFKKVQIFYINMHNFKVFNKLSEDKYIFTFGLTGDEKNIDTIQKITLENLKEKIKNPQFLSYNKNSSLSPFIKIDANDREDIVKTYFENTKAFLETSRKYIGNKIKSYDNYESSISGSINVESEFAASVIQEIESVISSAELNLSSLTKEKINEELSFESLSSLNGDTNLKIKQIENKNFPINKSDYSTSNTYIRHYKDHINEYEKFKSEFLKDQESKAHANCNGNGNGNISPCISQNNETNKYVTQSQRKTIVILIPMTIPGTGKTFFVDQLKEIVAKSYKEIKIEFESVSNDKIRRDVMDDIIYKKRVNETKAFELSNKETNSKFLYEIANKFNKLLYKKCSGLLYIDKNHPPNAVSKVFETIRGELNFYKYNSRNIPDVKFVALIPDCNDFINLSNNKIIPFSLSYFIQCYQRVRVRNDHPTLDKNNPDLLKILSMFICNFINFKFVERDLILHYQFDKMIKLPFTDEVSEGELPSAVVESAMQFFNSIPKDGAFANYNTNFTQNFENVMKKYYLSFTSSMPMPKSNSNVIFRSTKDYVKKLAKPIIINLYKVEGEVTSTYKSEKVLDFIYLGLKVSNHNTNSVYDLISQALQKIKSFDSKLKEAEQLSLSISKRTGSSRGTLLKNWKTPHKNLDMWHITTLYKGNASTSNYMNHPSYVNFVDGKEITVRIHAIAYIPYKTIFSIISADTHIDNKFPHMTTLISEFAPKQSNDVMKELFDKNGNLHKEYEHILNNNYKNSSVIKNTLRINGMYLDCYVYVLESFVVLKTNMTAFTA